MQVTDDMALISINENTYEILEKLRESLGLSQNIYQFIFLKSKSFGEKKRTHLSNSYKETKIPIKQTIQPFIQEKPEPKPIKKEITVLPSKPVNEIPKVTVKPVQADLIIPKEASEPVKPVSNDVIKSEEEPASESGIKNIVTSNKKVKEIEIPKPKITISKSNSSDFTLVKKSKSSELKPTESKEEITPASHTEVPKPETKLEVPKPETKLEIPKPETKLEVPKPETKLEAPKPAANTEVPKPAANTEVPKPAANTEAPKPEVSLEDQKHEVSLEELKRKYMYHENGKNSYTFKAEEADIMAIREKINLLKKNQFRKFANIEIGEDKTIKVTSNAEDRREDDLQFLINYFEIEDLKWSYILSYEEEKCLNILNKYYTYWPGERIPRFKELLEYQDLDIKSLLDVDKSQDNPVFNNTFSLKMKTKYVSIILTAFGVDIDDEERCALYKEFVFSKKPQVFTVNIISRFKVEVCIDGDDIDSTVVKCTNEKYLHRIELAIESIQKCDYPEEYVIVDNGNNRDNRNKEVKLAKFCKDKNIFCITYCNDTSFIILAYYLFPEHDKNLYEKDIKSINQL